MKPSKREFKTELFDQLARIGNALASGRRLELLDLLSQGERTVESLSTETEQPIANVSQHLQVLRRCRLVEVRRTGTYAFYRMVLGNLPAPPPNAAAVRAANQGVSVAA